MYAEDRIRMKPVAARRVLKHTVLAMLTLGAPSLALAVPHAVPTFHSIGLYWSPPAGTPEGTVSVRYRRQGSLTWKTGHPLWFDANAFEYRGSLVHLDPGTAYDVEMSLAPLAIQGQSADNANEGLVARLQATTWSEDFPIGAVITLPELSTETLVINRGGTKDGYVVYTHAAGKQAVIDVQNRRDHDIVVGASYVIIRGLTLTGARQNGIYFPFLGTYTDVVIEENDISNWGTWNGAFGVSSNAGVKAKGNRNVKRIVVQRNRIHHPRTDANSWCEHYDGTPDASCRTHPRGPWAVRLTDTGGNHVIRYNDVVSDDDHYFEDGIGGQGADDAGFLVRDSDVYGNYIERCWDNAIEAEGANINGRIWGNWIDRTYAPFGITPSTAGPLYIWRNIVNASRKGPFSADVDQNGKFIKAGEHSGGRVYIYHNTLLQPSAPLHGVRSGITTDASGGGAHNIVSRNNILHVVATSIFDTMSFANDYDHDLYNGTIPRGAEPHGVQGLPRYDSGSVADEYCLDPSSPGYDEGALLPTFNDDFAGSAPDMGACESGRPKLEFGVQAYRTPKNAPSSPSSNIKGMDVPQRPPARRRRAGHADQVGAESLRWPPR
jgi:hypothetical protein